MCSLGGLPALLPVYPQFTILPYIPSQEERACRDMIVDNGARAGMEETGRHLGRGRQRPEVEPRRVRPPDSWDQAFGCPPRAGPFLGSGLDGRRTPRAPAHQRPRQRFFAFLGGRSELGLIVAAFLVQAAAGALSGYLLARLGQGVVAALREKLWRKELGFPVAVRQGGLGSPRLEDDQRYGRGEGLHHRQSCGLGDRRHLHRRGDGLPPLPELEDDADHPRGPADRRLGPRAHRQVHVQAGPKDNGRERLLHRHPLPRPLGNTAREVLQRRGEGIPGGQGRDREAPRLRRGEGAAMALIAR